MEKLQANISYFLLKNGRKKGDRLLFPEEKGLSLFFYLFNMLIIKT